MCFNGPSAANELKLKLWDSWVFLTDQHFCSHNIPRGQTFLSPLGFNHSMRYKCTIYVMTHAHWLANSNGVGHIVGLGKKHTHRLVTNKRWLDSSRVADVSRKNVEFSTKPAKSQSQKSTALTRTHLTFVLFIGSVCVDKGPSALSMLDRMFYITSIAKQQQQKWLVTFSDLTSACAEMKEPPVRPVLRFLEWIPGNWTFFICHVCNLMGH